jgi:PAS domain S-box-containing protein
MKYLVTQKNRFHILLAFVLSVILISFFVNILYGRDIVYTHLFYFPIILAGLWYYKRALYVAVFLGLFHIGINYYQEGFIVSSVLIRAVILSVIAYVIGTLAETKDHAWVALNEAQQEKALILQNLTELVAFQDHEQRIIWANPAAAKIFGVNSEELMGQKCYEVWHKRRSPCEECPVVQALETGHVQSNEVKTSDGRYWSIIGSPVYDDFGIVIGAVETALEITDRKLAEEELQKLNTELERRVRERTAELEAVNNELDAFSYSVSHDLRAPLYTIDGFSRALLEDHSGNMNTEGRDYLVRINLASQRMGELIEDLLKLSRVTRQEMYREKLNLSKLASSYLTMMQEQDPKQQVECIVAPGIVVMGDVSLLRIALENLLSNAWKFTKNTKQVRIEFGASQQDGRTVFFISDNGAGFDRTYEDKLFKPFQRLHNRDEYTGTGIGLSIVSRIIHRHGGEIWANGEVGQGATFYFTLES